MEQEKPIERIIEEVLAAQPEVKEFDSGKTVDVRISLPYRNTVHAVIKNDRANIEYILVQPELRQKGIGEKLMRSLVEELSRRDVKVLTGSLENEGALKNRIKVFGENKIKLHPDFEIHGTEAGSINLTMDEAIKNFQKGEHVECEVDIAEPETLNRDRSDK
jgi:GNAT superfamily N-acetyltransferase